MIDEDWDNLIILDACRLDMFREHNIIDGHLKRRVSQGSCTEEFVKANLSGRDLSDTVYVTASGMVHRLAKRGWEFNIHNIVNAWNLESNNDHATSVTSEKMTQYALEAQENHPNKRLIVHYIQPHYPFFYTLENTHGYTREQLRKFDEVGTDFWDEIREGDLAIPLPVLWDAYESCLKKALPHVNHLVEELPGKSVITSDHGNMLNERARPFPIREWGHPPGIYTPQLVNVPWLVVESDDGRKQIVQEEPKEQSTTVDDEALEEHLSDLGYA